MFRSLLTLTPALTPALSPALSPALLTRLKFTLSPEDIKITNTLGSGPGGMKVATTKNCAVAKHLPTNIVVKCHETRSLEENTRIAIKKLTERVELELYKEESSVAMKAERKKAKNLEKRTKNKEEMEKKIAANKELRAVKEEARKTEVERILKSGLPFVKSVEDVTDECEEDAVSEDDLPPQTDFQKNETISQSKSLKSIFGSSNAKK